MQYHYQFKVNGWRGGMTRGVTAPLPSVDTPYIITRDDPLPETAQYLEDGFVFHVDHVPAGEVDGEMTYELVVNDQEPIPC